MLCNFVPDNGAIKNGLNYYQGMVVDGDTAKEVEATYEANKDGETPSGTPPFMSASLLLESCCL